MGTHMKTTIEIADALFHEARRVAERDATTFRRLVETGLRKVLAEKRSRPARFRLRDARFKGGKGLQRGAPQADWTAVRAAIYEGRGA